MGSKCVVWCSRVESGGRRVDLVHLEIVGSCWVGQESVI